MKSKNATAAVQYEEGSIEQRIADAFVVGELDDIIERLWYEYFCPAQTPKPEVRKRIMTAYNMAANKGNKLAEFIRHQTLTASVRWTPEPGDTGCDMEKKIFVDIKEFPKKKKLAAVVHMDTAPKGKERNMQNHAAAVMGTERPKPVRKSGEGGSIIEQIIALHKQGLSNKEIIAKGFNKSTVGRQVSEFKKRQ